MITLTIIILAYFWADHCGYEQSVAASFMLNNVLSLTLFWVRLGYNNFWEARTGYGLSAAATLL